MDTALSLFPNGGQIEEDNEYQLIIYTGLCSACLGNGTTGASPPGTASPCDVCHGTGLYDEKNFA